MTAPNTDIALHEGWIRVTWPRGSATAKGRIWLSWAPQPRVRFAVPRIGLFGEERVTVEFAVNRRRAKAEALLTNSTVRMGSRLEASLEGFLLDSVRVGAGRRVSYASFDLPNMPKLYNLVAFVADGWKVTLGRAATNEEFSALQREGGYGVTAAGQLEREDGREFDLSSARTVLESLSFYLSFATGMWTAPIVIDGHDGSGSVVASDWSIPRLSRSEYRPHWFPTTGQDDALRLFAQWHAQWLRPYWREVLRRITHFFVDANRAVVDIGLVLAQSALENLAYAISVIDLKSITPMAFDAKTHPAHAKLRDLLADVGVSPVIPSNLATLRAASLGPAVDGPGKITVLRNGTVHPLKSAPTSPATGDLVEAWLLAQWYVEAVVLSHLGYKGRVMSRTLQSEIDFP